GPGPAHHRGTRPAGEFAMPVLCGPYRPVRFRQRDVPAVLHRQQAGLRRPAVPCQNPGGHALTTPTPITVLLVDDDALIRTGLETILSSDPGLRVIAQAEHGSRAVELASRLQPQVILMDIRM